MFATAAWGKWAGIMGLPQFLGIAIALEFPRPRGDRMNNNSIKGCVHIHCQVMGRIRLKVRELATEKGWTLREVSNRSGVPYGTVKKYAQVSSLETVDYTALMKLARIFDVMMDDLVEVLEE